MSLLLLLTLSLTLPAAADERPGVIVVTGAPGTPDYDAQFNQWAGLWREAAARGGVEFVRIGEAVGKTGTDRERLQSALADRSSAGREPLWLVLIGHGTYDGRAAKYNLRGPDVSDAELAGWLASVKRPLVVIDGTSSSGPFLNKLSGPDRVVITATRSGNETNFARLGGELAGAVADPRADLDKDGQVSLLEAYVTAGARVAEFYKSKSRLSTEHALLDDNGDGLGTPPDWFRGVRATKRARDGAAADGLRAHQIHLVPSDRERVIPAEVRQRRDRLELQVAALRDQKASLPEDQYYARLEPLMIELAKLYASAKAPVRGF